MDENGLGCLNGLRGVPGVGGCDGGFCSEVVLRRVPSVVAFPLHVVPDHPVERNGARLQVGPGIESLLRRDPGHAGELPLEEALQHRLARRLRLIASDHPFPIDRLCLQTLSFLFRFRTVISKAPGRGKNGGIGEATEQLTTEAEQNRMKRRQKTKSGSSFDPKATAKTQRLGIIRLYTRHGFRFHSTSMGLLPTAAPSESGRVS